jgi:hypothetical protein
MSNDAILSGKGPDQQPFLAFVANRAYRIVNDRRATPIGDTIPIAEIVDFRPSSNEGARPVITADEGAIEPNKLLTDVLLMGSAHSTRGAVTSLETSLEVGAVHKRVRVLGRRTIEVGSNGKLSFTPPKVFTEMPLVWDNAYGGRDVFAEKRLAPRGGFGRTVRLGTFWVGYPRNYAGRGFFRDLERERLHGAELPNLEDPSDPVTPDRILSKAAGDWIDRPVAACYAPIDAFTFPRAAFLVRPDFDTPTRPVHELTSGAVLTDDLTRPLSSNAPPNPRVFNRAPAGLAVCRLTGRERVKLTNLHREHSNLEFDLPNDTPVFVLHLPGVGERRLEPILSTVSVEPDMDRVVMTWAASLRVAHAYPEGIRKTMPREVRWERQAA